MATPKSTANAALLMPVSLMGRCVSGSNDGNLIELSLGSGGLFRQEASTGRLPALSTDYFPSADIALDRGKVIFKGTDGTLSGTSTDSLVIESVTLAEYNPVPLGLDLDIYLGIGGSAEYSALWNGGTSLTYNTYRHLISTGAGLHIGHVPIRNSDYVENIGSMVASKRVGLSSQVNDSVSSLLHVCVIYSGSLTSTISAQTLQVQIQLRVGG